MWSGDKRQNKFEVLMKFLDGNVCSMENPNQDINKVGSKNGCVLQCLEILGCRGVNWVETNKCEIYGNPSLRIVSSDYDYTPEKLY